MVFLLVDYRNLSSPKFYDSSLDKSIGLYSLDSGLSLGTLKRLIFETREVGIFPLSYSPRLSVSPVGPSLEEQSLFPMYFECSVWNLFTLFRVPTWIADKGGVGSTDMDLLLSIWREERVEVPPLSSPSFIWRLKPLSYLRDSSIPVKSIDESVWSFTNDTMVYEFMYRLGYLQLSE